MKRSSSDFSNPTRQSKIAVLLILMRTVNVVFRQVMPAVIVIILGGSEKKSDQFLYLGLGVTVISLIISIINYFRMYFYISGNDLILHSGVLKSKKTTIPFARIQSVNFEQHFVHQLFDVVNVKIDTAGSDKSEFEFHALDRHSAVSLRDLVLKSKDQLSLQTQQEEGFEMPVPAENIITLSETEVLKVGLTMNHLKSGGLIFLFFFWLYEQFSEIQMENNIPENWNVSWIQDVKIISVLLALMALVSVCISVIRSFMKYYNLKLDRMDQGFKVYSGLITRKEVSALDHKIQYVSWSDNLLRRLIGIYQLTLHQVVTNQMKEVEKILIPGCSSTRVQRVLKYVFGEKDLTQIVQTKVHPAYFYRFLMWIMLVGGTASILLLILAKMIAGMIAAALTVYLILNRYLSFNRKRYGMDEDVILLKNGTFGNHYTLMNSYKVQTAEISQSPYQKKRDLCNCHLHAASGTFTIPYIPKKTATAIIDNVLWHVQTSKHSWM